MALEFKNNNTFEDLGSLEDFLKDYGDCQIEIENINEINICLIIKSEQQIDFRIYCSKPLSEIIKSNDFSFEDFMKYNLYRITNEAGQKYLRLTKEMQIDSDPDIHLMDFIKTLDQSKGSYKINIKIDGWKKKILTPVNLDSFFKKG
ncbi:MAG: hypothetical protein WCY58_13235 [Mariniphaga sp.]|nr:hypothetical protein [Mariniphaga sp.]MDD4227583.1 hypothetical protein [Mariniphaga sp.]MDD4425152.1 hypothetical protein [Mariniphaga sp.]